MSDRIDVYEARADHSHFRWLGVKRTTMKPLGLLLRGEPLASTWDPPLVEELVDDELPGGEVADFAHLDAVPTFSTRAVAALGDMLLEHGELLPLAGPGLFYVYNVTRIIDALDAGRSAMSYFASTGRLKTIESYVFREDALRDAVVFRLPQVTAPSLFVTDAFVGRIHAAGLTGFDFLHLWGATTQKHGGPSAAPWPNP